MAVQVHVAPTLEKADRALATYGRVLEDLRPYWELLGRERTDRPLIRHEFSCEVTVSSSSENGADEKLDAIVTAVRGRLHAAEIEADPIILPDHSTALVQLLGTRWSVSAGDSASTIRGAAIALAVSQVDEVGGGD